MEQLPQTRLSVESLQHILKGTDVYLYVSDLENDDILFVTDNLREHYNMPGDIAGKKCWQIFQAGRSERCEFCPNARLKEQPIITWEEKNPLNGRWYRNSDSLIKWSDGRLVHLQHRVDITELKNAEQNLHERLRQQELTSVVAEMFISPEDTTVLINRALDMLAQFMNVSRAVVTQFVNEAPTGKPRGRLAFQHEWISPELDGVVPVMGQNVPFEESILTYDEFIGKGKLHVCRSAAQMAAENYCYITDLGVQAFLTVAIMVDGKFWGFLGFDDFSATREWSESDIRIAMLISRLISGLVARKETEAELMRMSAIVNTSARFITYITPEGKFAYFNNGALQTLGYSSQELQNQNVDIIFDDTTRAYVKEQIFPRVLQEGRIEFEAPIIRKDGQMRILSFCSFITGPSNEHGIGSIAVDVTEIRRLEHEVIAAKEQAEKSSQAKGEFLSRMSHEIRTPLNAIIGMTEIAKSSSDLEKKEYCLEKIEAASVHLLGVINDILDMSKIEASKFELFHTEFSFEDMLMRVVNVINFRVEEKEQTLIVNIDKNMPWSIVSDEQRIAQVITNLLSNAVKFTPPQGTIILSARKTDEQNNICTIKVSVEDTGIGISAEQQARLFNSFEQADGGIARKFGGTGLGLAISKSIVEMTGGAIWVESEPEKGSTFSFTIKAAQGRATHESRLPREINWRNLRILAVDDAAHVREFFSNFAETTGVYCQVAEGGAQACEILRENKNTPFDAIFVDWQMPNMNGIELIRQINSEFASHAVIIMISAFEWAKVEAKAKSVGVEKFIPKPLFKSLITDCLKQCCGVKPQEKATQQPPDNSLAASRMLLVEDIRINREIVSSLLKPTGIAIESAENGAQAVEMFTADPSRYDIIFMDIHMPEMDGYEATRIIRALDVPQGQTIPIIAMTADVFKEDIEKCLAAGMNDHVGKPINKKEMLDKLKSRLPQSGPD